MPTPPFHSASAPRLHRLSLLLGATLLLSACGGSGGPGPSGLGTTAPLTPPPAASPAPAPAPKPPVNYDTAEYRRSNATVAAGALAGWEAGATGNGVLVGIIDSGLSDPGGEFAGRLHAASRDVTGQGRTLDDPSGHGTAVAGVLTAGRNDQGIVGIAPAASLLFLRADNNDCASGCRFSDSAIASGLDAAVAAGARVVNISLGGSSASTALRTAFQRATAAGVVLVISAGNDAETEPDPLARAALAAGGSGNVIVAGASDANGVLSSFSNAAGTARANYLVALGERVRSLTPDGGTGLYSGTSFAAPTISGAVALLAENFPKLSGRDLVDIILGAADDAGAAGTDAIYGRGLLNIGAAIAPAGETRLAGTDIRVAVPDSGALGGAFGDGMSQSHALASVEVTDRYGRAYGLPLAASLRLAPAGRLRGRLLGASLATASTTAHTETLTLDLQIRADRRHTGSARGFQSLDTDTASLGFAQRGLDAHAASRNPLRETRLGLTTANGLGLVLATGQLAAESLPGSAARGFVTDDGLTAEDGANSSSRLLVMAAQNRGPLTLAMAASRRDIDLGAIPGLGRQARQTRLTLAAGYAAGPWNFALHASHALDTGALLGTRLAPGFGLNGGRTLSLGGAVALAQGGYELRLAGSIGQVQPQIARGALLRADGNLRLSSWSLSGAAPAGPGRLRLQLSGPAVISGGHFQLANGARIDARARAHETAAELGFDLGALSVAAFNRRNAGNIRGLTDRGAALSYRANF